jgi:parallel beta-helix repeat protein
MIRSGIGIIGSYRSLFLYNADAGQSNPSGPAYYFSSTLGNDSNTISQATSSATPWKSLSKLNSVMSTMTSSYSVAFKRDDVFTGSITLAKSGLTFEAWGSGANPVISGFVDLTWTSLGSNLWESQTLSATPEVVLISGAYRLPARMPKSGFYTFESSSGTNTITDNQLTGSWAGGTIVVRKNHTTWDRGIISQSSGTTLTFTGADANPFYQNGWGYFIQNHVNACTVDGDWSYSTSTTKITLFSSTTPSNCKASVVSALFQGTNFSTTVRGLDFIGSNNFAINILSGSTCSISNCNISNNGSVGILVSGNPGVNITGNILTNTNNVGMIIQTCVSASVTYNILNTTGILGRGTSTSATNKQDYFAMAFWDASTGAICKYNQLYDSGFNAINFYYTSGLTIQNNFIQRFNLYKGDGGGIYTYVAGAGTYTNITVADNIVVDGGGEHNGRSDTTYQSCYGIYMDDDTDNVTIARNTVANNPAAGIFIHSSQNISLYDNLIYNNGNTLMDPASASQLQFLSNTYNITGLIVSGNIMFPKATYQYPLQGDWNTNTIASSFTSLNMNYYFQPISTSSFVARTYVSGDPTAIFHSFSAWKTYTGQDANSSASFIQIANTGSLRFEYNATTSSVSISLGTSSYYTVSRNLISGTLSLGAFSSSVLIRSGS